MAAVVTEAVTHWEAMNFAWLHAEAPVVGTNVAFHRQLPLVFVLRQLNE